MCPSHRTAGRNAKIARQELSSIEHRDHALHPLPIAAGRLVCCLRVDPLVHFGFSVIHRILCLVATVPTVPVSYCGLTYCTQTAVFLP